MNFLGWQELFMILFLALLVFGTKKLPEIGSSLGKGIRSFKESLNFGESRKPSKEEEEEGEKNS